MCAVVCVNEAAECHFELKAFVRLKGNCKLQRLTTLKIFIFLPLIEFPEAPTRMFLVGVRGK